MATTPKVLTYEEWLTLPTVEDGREEVVNGEVIYRPPNALSHPRIIQRLISLLIPQVDQRLVEILGSTFGLVICREPLTCRSPDLALFWKSKMVEKDGLIHSPPDLVIEVLSPSESRKRKEEKLADYAKIGVPEAWLLSPQAQSVEVRKLRDGKLVVEKVVVEGTLTPEHFPGVVIDVASIWPG